MGQPIGSMLDSLGVVANLDEHERITDVIIVGKVTKLDAPDEATRIIVSSSEHSDWVTKLGLIYAGRTIIDGDIEKVGD